MGDKVDVSVVIVSWNTRDLLRACLASIARQPQSVSIEVIVVDNASRDGTPDMVADEFPDVHLIRNELNRGFAAANNQGMRLRRGRYVLLLNPDTIILDRAIAKTKAYADAHPDIGVVGCQVLEDDRRIQRTGFSFPTPWNLFLVNSGLSRCFPRSRLFGQPELGWWDRTTERDVEVVSGMFMLVKQEVINRVGLLDEDYFVYGEEADWCFRIWKAGWRCVFAPVGQIIHLDGGGKSTSQVSIRMFVQLQKSLMIFQRKNLGWRAWAAAKLVYTVSNLIRGVAWLALAMVRRDATLRRKASAAAAALKFHLRGVEPA